MSACLATGGITSRLYLSPKARRLPDMRWAKWWFCQTREVSISHPLYPGNMILNYSTFLSFHVCFRKGVDSTNIDFGIVSPEFKARSARTSPCLQNVWYPVDPSPYCNNYVPFGLWNVQVYPPQARLARRSSGRPDPCSSANSILCPCQKIFKYLRSYPFIY